MSRYVDQDGEELPEVIEMGGVTLRPGDRIGPYVYQRPVGRGGMAHILLARDPAGREVALKVLKSSRLRGTGRDRFNREFRALARLNHPNVIRVESSGDIHGHPYIAMEYVEGRDLHQTIRAFRKMPDEHRWARTEEILIDLCQALAYIHRRGLVHRDLKPSNILINEEGRCKLTDFGIVKDLDPSSDAAISTTLVGTWAYASPEQITGAAIDHRSDLYSLGVMLFAMLTGRRPFVAKDMAGYLELHRDHSPRRPSQVNPDVPERIEEICMKLLQKRPRDRFQSAQEILYRLERIDPHEAQTQSVSDDPVWDPPMVGRDVELGIVRDAVSALTRGDGGCVILLGDEGTGKSRVMQVMLDQAKLIGIPVHYARPARMRGAFQSLLHIAKEIGSELGDVPPALESAIVAFAKGRGNLPGDTRYQLYDGVRDALMQLLVEGPRIIAIDDLNFAPPPLLALIGYLVRTIVARESGPLLLVVAARPDASDMALTSFLDGSDLETEPTCVRIKPLTRAAVGELVEGLLGSGEPARILTERLHRETEGNPLFVAEFLRSLLQRGVIAPGPKGGLRLAADADEIATGHLEIPPGVRQVVRNRLAPLHEDARLVVDVVAVSGREIELDLLLDVLDDDEDAVLDRIDHLVDAGILIERHAALNTFYDFAHRKVGDVAYRDLDPDRRAELHRRFGGALEIRHASSPVSAEAIGEHYRRAGDSGKAYRYLVTAALRLWERSLLAEAWELTERAAALDELALRDLPGPEHERSVVDLLRVRSDVYYNRGEWADAESAVTALIDSARALGRDKLVWQSQLRLGSIWMRRDRDLEGLKLIGDVLAEARRCQDRGSVLEALRYLAAAHWDRGEWDDAERLVQEGLVSATGGDRAEIRAELLLALAAVQASRGQMAAATAGLAEAEAILQGLRAKRGRCLALCNLSEVLVWQGELAAAWRRATDALGLARDVLYREGEAFALRVRGMVLLHAGDDKGARRELDAALAIGDQIGAAADVVPSEYLRGVLCLREAEPEQALVHLEHGLETAAVKDPEYYLQAFRSAKGEALARLGRHEEGTALLEEVNDELADLPLPRRVQTLTSAARAWWQLGKRTEALECARQASLLAGTRGFRVWALEARLLVCQIAGDEEAARAAVEAKELARELLRSMTPEMGALFRSRARVARLLGS